jgi:hypothetical protein
MIRVKPASKKHSRPMRSTRRARSASHVAYGASASVALEAESDLSVKHRHGLFGGLDPDERVELARRRATSPDRQRLSVSAAGPPGPTTGELRLEVRGRRKATPA